MRSTRSTTGDGAERDVLEKLSSGLSEFGARLDQVLVGLGVFDEGGRGADFAREEVGSFGGQVPDRRAW